MFLADYHMHTYISHDGRESMADMAAAAKRAGMKELCFTDHCDVADWKSFSPTGADEHVLDDVNRDWRELLKGGSLGIEVRRGIELGEAQLYPEKALEYAEKAQLDFIIGSVHMLRADGDFYAVKYRSREHCEALYDSYLDECLEVARLNFFDVMGHIGYCRRYMAAAGFDVELDFFKCRDKIELLLRTLIQNGRGIELNASGYAGGLGFFPNEEILRLYKALGGEIITVGSDAHYAADAGRSVREGYELLRALGFRRVTVFRERAPQFIDI